ncbi:unnamed protein product [Closterium sp. NIES-65]|nr:unnamed protein product [Closterium sp. NIES-65]
MSEAKRVRLGFVGAGQMAEALARGMSAAGVVAASDMSAMDLSQERLAVFAEMGVAAKTTCKELAAASDAIFIAVKPHRVKAALSELRDSAANFAPFPPFLPVSPFPLSIQLAAASDVIFIAVKPHRVKAVLSELRDSAAITSTHLVVSIAGLLSMPLPSFPCLPSPSSLQPLAAASDVIFIAVKPHTVKAVLSELRDSAAITSTHLVVSIAAGVTIANLQQWAGDEAKIVRVMPNTPCLVGQTAAAMSLGGKATAEDAALVQRMFEAVGKIQQVEEKLLDAVTGLSGSGPAYVFMAIEALADGGVAAGLPRDVALSLAAQTVYGSAKMVLETGKHPGQLKDSVASPGGTTIAGIYALEKGGFRATLMNAVVAATERSKELSK